MSSPPSSSSRPRRRGSAPDAVERLYVYWVVSTALLVLAVLVGIILTRGMLHRQNEVLNKLEQRVAALETASRQADAGVAKPSDQRPAPAEPAAPGPAAAPTAEAPPATRPADQPVALPGNNVLDDQLVGLLSQARRGIVADPAEADRLLDLAERYLSAADWPSSTWARLATLARLRGRDALCAALAQRVTAMGGPEYAQYLEVSVRSLLHRGATEEALRFARQFNEHTGGQPVARVLLAAVLVEAGNPAAADEVLESLPDVAELSVADRLLLGRLLLHLERGRRLEEVLNRIGEVPPELAAEHNFLTAVGMARAGRTVEALAILDWLAGLPGPQVSGEAGTSSGWPLPRPSPYEVHVWRGVTLMFAQQPEAARQALNYALSLDQRRPEAPYYLGVLEARAGRRQMAESYLRNTLAGTPGYAPACEALALLEMEDGRISMALEHLRQAISANPRRPGAYFLLGVAYARISQAEPAADALRQAFRLDPAYLEEARHTEVLLRLFTADDLERLAKEEPEPEKTEPVEQSGAEGRREGE